MTSISKYFTQLVKTKVFTTKVLKYTEEEFNAEYSDYELVNQKYKEAFKLCSQNKNFDMIFFASVIDASETGIYSLFRLSADEESATILFEQLSNALFLLYTIKFSSSSNVVKNSDWLGKIANTCRQNPGWNAAHIAADLGYLDAFKVESIAELVNSTTLDKSFSPLSLAIKNNNLELIKLLLSLENIDFSFRDMHGNSYLHLAAAFPNAAILDLLLAQKTQPQSNFQKLIRCLSKRNRICFNCLNHAGQSPIYISCEKKSLECLQSLLKVGADPSISQSEFSPIHICIQNDSIEMLNSIIEAYPFVINTLSMTKKLAPITMYKSRKMLDRLIELGGDINLVDENGQSLLHKKSKERDLELVMALLIRHVDVNTQDCNGFSALHIACDLELGPLNVSLIRALIVFGGDVNLETNEGYTPRHILCRQSFKYRSVTTKNSALDESNQDSNINLQEDKNSDARLNVSFGKYTSTKQKDLALFTLHAVGAKRCHSEIPHCTSGCRAPTLKEEMEIKRQRTILNPDDELSEKEVPSEKHTDSNGGSFWSNLLTGSFANSSVENPESLFDGTPPNLIMDQRSLEDEIADLAFSILKDYNPNNTSRMSIGSYYVSDDGFNHHRHSNSSLKERQSNSRTVSPSRSGATSPEIVDKQSDICSNPIDDKENLEIEYHRNEDVTPMKDFCYEMKAIVDVFPTPYLDCACLLVPTIDRSSFYPFDSNCSQEYQSNDRVNDCISESFNLYSDQNNSIWTRRFDHCNSSAESRCCRAKFGVSVPHNKLFSCNSNFNDSDDDALTKKKFSLENEEPKKFQPLENQFSYNAQTPLLERYLKERSKFTVGPFGYRILCLDGGGVRGLIHTQVLIMIEQIAKKPIRELYDWIVGTSTGGVVSLHLANGQCAAYCRSLYFEFKEKVFCGKRPYDAQNFENLMKHEFGEKTCMTDLTHLKIGVTTLLGDRFPPSLHIFRNYLRPTDILGHLIEQSHEKLCLHPLSDIETSLENTILLQKRLSLSSIELFSKLSRNLTEASWAPDVNSVEFAHHSSYLHSLARSSPLMAYLVGAPTTSLKTGAKYEQNTIVNSNDKPRPSNQDASSPVDSVTLFHPVENEQQLVWQAARASGAAPTYFRACGAYLDGGLISNNPTMDALTEVHETNLIRELLNEPRIPVAVVTSIGTGRRKVMKEQSIDVYRPGGIMEIYRSAKGISSLGRILVAMATYSEGRIIDRTRAWCAAQGTAYFRFSPLLSNEIALDCVDTEELLQMMWENHAYLVRCRPRLERLVAMLEANSFHSQTPDFDHLPNI